MKNGKYGFFIASAIFLAVTFTFLVLGLALGGEIFEMFEEILNSDDNSIGKGLAAISGLLLLIVVVLAMSAFQLVSSILGLIFSIKSIQRSERVVFRVFSIIFCVSHSTVLLSSMIPIVATVIAFLPFA